MSARAVSLTKSPERMLAERAISRQGRVQKRRRKGKLVAWYQRPRKPGIRMRVVGGVHPLDRWRWLIWCLDQPEPQRANGGMP